MVLNLYNLTFPPKPSSDTVQWRVEVVLGPKPTTPATDETAEEPQTISKDVDASSGLTVLKLPIDSLVRSIRVAAIDGSANHNVSEWSDPLPPFTTEDTIAPGKPGALSLALVGQEDGEAASIG